MAKCTVCGNLTHDRRAHVQACAICGSNPTIIERTMDVNYAYKCNDDALHARIRGGFGSREMVRLRDTPPKRPEVDAKQAAKRR